MKSGNLNVAKKAGSVLLKGKVYFEPVIKELVKSPSPKEIVETAIRNPQVERNKPRFLFSTDFEEFVSYDTKRKEWLEVAFKELGDHYTFFLPLAGMEKTSFQEETDADVRAAEQMAKLYDLILADNPPSSKAERHQLNVFLTRLLFCYFAEDTGIFPDQLFTNAIESYTQSDGSDVGGLLQDIFLVLNTKKEDRKKPRPHLEKFPYVNGGLFNDTTGKRSSIPQFTSKSRLKLIDLGNKSWKEINPDIFGSMFQGVVDEEVRADLGMHYTSVPNIMKVIKPLFLDDLYEEFEKANGSESKLNSLLNRIYRLRIFDPACGSGNFLIIAYKELRRLEMAIFKELQTLTTQLPLSGILVSQFYGIEIDDFAHEVAILAMWLAEHQMNVEFKVEFGDAPATLPLREGAKVFCGNSLRLDWEDVCPISNNEQAEVFVLGNPPYSGARKQSLDQKEDIVRVAGHIKSHKNLDYISAFFLKAAEFIKNKNASCAFVSTNSICQGEQVELLWLPILKSRIEIGFAHTAFRWSNNAKGKAVVTCIIVGIRNIVNRKKVIYSEDLARTVKNISPYLIDASNLIVTSLSNKTLSALPPIRFGNMPNNGEGLFLNAEEVEVLRTSHPESACIVRRVLGSQEFIDGIGRWCLWIDDSDLKIAREIPFIRKRIDKVREARLASNDVGANKLAERSHQFRDRTTGTSHSVLIPGASSERRDYIPIGWIEPNTIITNLAHVIYDAPLWVFSAVSSRMHMVWVKTVAGRLKTDCRYSSAICYNNFPFPKVASHQIEKLEHHAELILLEREKHPNKTIAALYDPKTMPPSLLACHKALDGVVEQLYRSKPFERDEDRIEYLFAQYEQLSGAEPVLAFQPSLIE